MELDAMVIFEQVADGEWFEPKPQIGHRMKCCDCGLVHAIDFRVRAGKVQVRAVREKRARVFTRRFWTSAEVRTLVQEFPHKMCKEIGVMLGRPTRSIVSKANLLGLTKSDAYIKTLHRKRPLIVHIGTYDDQPHPGQRINCERCSEVSAEQSK